MPRRHEIDFIREEFEKKGCLLKSTEYVNSKTKLDFICPNGHEHSIIWNSFQRGISCPYCSGQSKPTIDYIRSQFMDRGLILESTVYVNNRVKLKYTCLNGHKHSISWKGFCNGQGCPYCSGKAKRTLEYVVEYFGSYGYVVTSKEYINAYTKLDYICPNGHKNSMTWFNFQQGTRCPTCYYLSKFGETNPNWKGGIDTSPYCLIWSDKEYKESIKNRDNYICQNPYCKRIDYLLTIHHIDYDKGNCGFYNLITLCRSCNSMANTDRGWHKLWYQTIMNKKYGYTY